MSYCAKYLFSRANGARECVWAAEEKAANRDASHRSLYSRPICTTRHDAMTVAACCRELRMTMVAVRPVLMAYMLLLPAVSVGRRDDSSGLEQND